MSNTIIHIGFPKTGTTFIQNYFDKHPEIYHNRDRFKEYYKSGIINEFVLSDTQHAKLDGKLPRFSDNLKLLNLNCFIV